MNEIQIHTANPADLNLITEVHRRGRNAYHRGHVPDEELDSPEILATFRDAWARAMNTPEYAVFCAWQEDSLAGIATVRPCREHDYPDINNDAAELGTLHVDPPHWRQGVGTALHDACVAEFRKRSASAAYLFVSDYNTRARVFYARHNWHPDGHHYPGDKHNLRYRLSTLS